MRGKVIKSISPQPTNGSRRGFSIILASCRDTMASIDKTVCEAVRGWVALLLHFWEGGRIVS